VVRPTRPWAALAGLALLSGCAAPTTGETPPADPPVLPSAGAVPSLSPSPELAAPSPAATADVPRLGEAVRLYAGADVGAADVAVMQRFVMFAADPTPEGAQLLGLATTGVRLGLGPRLVQDLDIATAGDPAAWSIPSQAFRAHIGPYSALAVVRQQVEGADADPTRWPSSDLQVSVGDHPHCASPPVPAPEGLDGRRRVSVQPGEGSITSCLDWFTVDLFLDDDDAIVAVTLDIWEP